MVQTKGEAGTGDVVEAVKYIRTVTQEISRAKATYEGGMKEL